MSLDRQEILKRDFEIVRRGYDIDAVDGHLSVLAEHIESLQNRLEQTESDLRAAAGVVRDQSETSSRQSLAGSAAEQVRDIISVAENSASEIHRQALSEAAQIKGDADTYARDVRREVDDELALKTQQAGAAAQQHVAGVYDSTSSMLERVHALEEEVSNLVDQIRGTSQKVRGDLKSLHTQVADVSGIPLVVKTEISRDEPTSVSTAVEPEPVQEQGAARVQTDQVESTDQGQLSFTAVEVQSDSAHAGAHLAGSEQTSSAPKVATSEDETNARLYVLNQVHLGEDRQTIIDQARELYAVDNLEQLVDDVIAATS